MLGAVRGVVMTESLCIYCYEPPLSLHSHSSAVVGTTLLSDWSGKES